MFISSIKSSADFVRTLTAWLLICSVCMTLLPLTHADHKAHDHGSYQQTIDGLSVLDANDHKEPKEQSKHQHIGMNEHHVGLVSLTDQNLFVGLDTSRWLAIGLATPVQNFLYLPHRPPNF